MLGTQHCDKHRTSNHTCNDLTPLVVSAVRKCGKINNILLTALRDSSHPQLQVELPLISVTSNYVNCIDIKCTGQRVIIIIFTIRIITGNFYVNRSMKKRMKINEKENLSVWAYTENYCQGVSTILLRSSREESSSLQRLGAHPCKTSALSPEQQQCLRKADIVTEIRYVFFIYAPYFPRWVGFNILATFVPINHLNNLVISGILCLNDIWVT